ncbi:MAG: single-stranded DNA-binding protein [Oscillospiraceae bacterium]|nr:single-stranded DNA-binding protein [Oscillospiraceae bacterium]
MAFMKLSSGEFMIVGVLPKDAEYKTVGEKNSSLTKFSVKASEKTDANGEKIANWTNCTAWHDAARVCKDFKKKDVVMVVGKIEEREYEKNGEKKKSKELVVDFAVKMASVAAAPPPPKENVPDIGDLDDFEEILNDGTVPF